MLNPIDAETVVRDGGAHGRFPGQIHAGVAWWMAACFVVTARACRLVVAHDGKPSSSEFFDRLCQGAVNAQHYACQVLNRGQADEVALLAAMRQAGDAPGILVTTKETGGDTVQVTITLYGRDGKPLDETDGLAAIRRMIAEDRVPIPVNEASKGRVQPFTAAAGEGKSK
ncbi:hypothetical protein GCM10010387_03630 [Streptomyces inusitatus]|uniref:Uncharacterized protein n=1 Tax=Streptomyces inusitatus TaxID=68221 RepID=A0A918UJN1_9ACTN|nr:hypothetical protein [Streptomyces inusitatus]GGZ14725.1 hypothetical protein GCM10010387_03630 [Streptomyces inusitatus]